MLELVAKDITVILIIVHMSEMLVKKMEGSLKNANLTENYNAWDEKYTGIKNRE